VKVSVKGAVRNSGTYYVPKGTAWIDVLKQCGGIRNNGYIAEGFDFNAPITENTSLFVPYKITWDKTRYENAHKSDEQEQ
jgi:hypothetical protein